MISRSHGFASWPEFAAHVESLQQPHSNVSLFESAVEAIISGDAETLAPLLREHPKLSRARSTREHNALLIYLSANGVEGYRQKSPKNAPAIAEMLLDDGAEVDATAAVYGREYTTLGLIATSVPPHAAGVQIALIDILLQHGARMKFADDHHNLIGDCLANGQPKTAAYLARRMDRRCRRPS